MLFIFHRLSRRTFISAIAIFLKTHLTRERAMEAINKWYAGWAGYYEMTQYPRQLRRVEAHVRRRLRARKLLVKRGIPRPPESAKDRAAIRRTSRRAKSRNEFPLDREEQCDYRQLKIARACLERRQRG